MTTRLALTVAVALLVASVLLVVAGSVAAPLSRDCDPSLPDGACAAAVSAVERRGLAAIHPLIVSAQVEPGSEAGSEQVGHRATVRFEMLPALRPLSIELHYDQGGHWGGVPDRDDVELAAYALMPVVLAGLAGGVIVILSLRRRRRPQPPTG